MRRFQIGSVVLALFLGLFVAGCGKSQTVTTVYNDPSISCPVPPDQLEQTLSGAYGVDGEQRPVNEHGFPIDVEGHCLVNQPVAEVYYSQPSPYYMTQLGYIHPGYVWVAPLYYRPLVTYGYSVNVRRNVVPSGHVTVVQSYKPAPTMTTTTVKPGSATSARPNVGSPGATVGAPPSAARPNVTAQPSSAATAPATIAPKGGAQTQTFNRAPAPAPAAVAPTTIAPRGGAASSAFSRPSAPSSSGARHK